MLHSQAPVFAVVAVAPAFHSVNTRGREPILFLHKNWKR